MKSGRARKAVAKKQREEITMHRPMSNFHFKLMSFGYRFRDLFLPRSNALNEVGIRAGFHVMDYGCGPGSYSIIAAEMVGTTGKVYALDIHPLAVQRVENIASRKKLGNVVTIRSDCKTGLPDDSVDVVLLYDTFHTLSDPDGILEELHRVLKPNGILSFSDHHMKEDEIISEVTDRGLFRLSTRAKSTYSFSRG